MNENYQVSFFDKEQSLEWEKLISGSGEFLQSFAWRNFQESLGRKVWCLEIGNSDLLALIIKQSLPFNRSYFYVPRGPIIKNYEKPAQDSLILKIFLEEIKKIAIEEKVIFLKIEPTGQNSQLLKRYLETLGFQKKESIQPDETLILDLTQSEEKILEEMEYETRYAIKTAKRRGVKIIELSEFSEKKRVFEDFYKLLQETAHFHHFKTYPKDYYWKVLNLSHDNEFDVRLFVAELNEKIIGVAIFIFFNKITASYLYSASAQGYGRFNAPSLLLWEAILKAKNEGFKIFDFWGISETNKKWSGITAFKKSFGGKEKKYAGTWDFVFDRSWYTLYKIAKKIIG